MNEKIQAYIPPKGADMVLRISRDGENISESIAHSLYDRYFEEATQRDETPRAFIPNYAYVFDNGIVFRLYDPEEGPDAKVIEVMADPDHASDRAKVMCELPDVLRKAGVANERALELVGKTIQDKIVQSHIG